MTKQIIFTEAHKRHISEAKKGTDLSANLGNWSKKGATPWNKGKRGIYSQKTLEALKKSRLGKKLSEETKRKIRESAHYGAQNHNWKGGRNRHEVYIVIKKPDHPFADANGYVYEHRLVMEQQLGRYLQSDEMVHHINGKGDDNRLENLQLVMGQKDHARFHTMQCLCHPGRKHKSHNLCDSCYNRFLKNKN